MADRIFGYARVSTREQNEDRQMLALQAAGVRVQDIFLDKLSGKDFQRPQYKKLMKKLRQGDVLFIKAIDRLGRNYDEIIRQWRVITKEIRADVVVLDMPLLDTRRKGQDLTGTFIADLVLQILSYVAETERQNIRQRQAEGIAAAKARGVRFGREEKPRPTNFQEVCGRWERGELSARTAAGLLEVTHPTFLRWAQREPALKG